jgi:hypothetical protein
MASGFEVTRRKAKTLRESPSFLRRIAPQQSVWYRYEPHIAEGLTQMFVAGTSTHKVGEVAQTLMGVAPPKCECHQSPQPDAHPTI